MFDQVAQITAHKATLRASLCYILKAHRSDISLHFVLDAQLRLVSHSQNSLEFRCLHNETNKIVFRNENSKCWKSKDKIILEQTGSIETANRLEILQSK